MSRSNSEPARVLVVDNHDSFVFTLVGYLRELGADACVVESDELTDSVAAVSGWDGVMISPGPGTPERAGRSVDVVRAAADARTPLLGVCLGHQALATAFGASVTVAPEPMHGRPSALAHDGAGLFDGLVQGFSVGRYHSLAVDEATLPPSMRVTARAANDGVVMGISHADLPLHGVQFHPESVLTEHGYRMLANWLREVGVADAAARASMAHARGL